jgi:CheY-like chemotaxis protein
LEEQISFSPFPYSEFDIVQISMHSISRVAIVEDDETVRRSYSRMLEDMGLTGVELPGQYQTIEEAIVAGNDAQVFVCDHRLQRSGYAAFFGAELAAALYRQSKPAILCSKFAASSSGWEIALNRRWLPVVLQEPDEDAISAGIEACISELAGEPATSRRPWRTLVRIEQVDQDVEVPLLRMVVPAWNSQCIVTRPINAAPEFLRAILTPGHRFHAGVNIGAETDDELFFCDWETD